MRAAAWDIVSKIFAGFVRVRGWKRGLLFAAVRSSGSLRILRHGYNSKFYNDKENGYEMES